MSARHDYGDDPPRRRKHRLSLFLPLLLCGVVLFGFAARSAWRNINEEQQAEKSAESVLQSLNRAEAGSGSSEEPPPQQSGLGEYVVPDYVMAPDMEMPEIEIDGLRYIGRLSIPKLGVELPIISHYDYSKHLQLRTAPARYAGSIYSNDCVICGHNYPSHFGGLKNLELGDQAIFTDNDGNVFVYELVKNEILDGYDVEGMLADGDWDLTLYTCTLARVTRVTARFKLVKTMPASAT